MDDSQLNELMQITLRSMKEISSISLQSEVTPLSGRADLPLAVLVGAYVSLVGKEYVLQLGICSNDHGLKTIAGLMMGMTPEERAALTEDELADAIGEIGNMLCGSVKKKLASKDPTLQIGIPILVRGQVEVSSSIQSAEADVSIGDVPIRLVVLKGSKPAGQ